MVQYYGNGTTDRLQNIHLVRRSEAWRDENSEHMSSCDAKKIYVGVEEVPEYVFRENGGKPRKS